MLAAIPSPEPGVEAPSDRAESRASHRRMPMLGTATQSGVIGSGGGSARTRPSVAASGQPRAIMVTALLADWRLFSASSVRHDIGVRVSRTSVPARCRPGYPQPEPGRAVCQVKPGRPCLGVAALSPLIQGDGRSAGSGLRCPQPTKRSLSCVHRAVSPAPFLAGRTRSAFRRPVSRLVP